MSPHALVGLACLCAIGAGRVVTEELALTSAEGPGYALGIIGLGSMTALLAYSLRKRLRFLRNAGSMRRWFEFHLVLGLLGPTAILYHSGFELGSMNSTVSLASMLLVAGSGVSGRYFYGRMYRSLAGSRRTVGGFLKEAAQELEIVGATLDTAPEARIVLTEFAENAAATPPPWRLPFVVLAIRPSAFLRKRRAIESIRTAARPGLVGPAVRETLDRYFALICRGVELRWFEKLFSIWHAIHVPLTIVMFVSAAVHVLAVHLY